MADDYDEVLKGMWDLAEMHRRFIQDDIRNQAYRAALSKYVDSSKVVLEIGCGSGILSSFAAQAGAKRVYAVERSDIISYAKEAAKLNKLSKQIKFVKSDIFSLKIKEKVDVILHEQIGNFLWDEDMQRKVGHIRDNYLKKDGIILPAHFELYLVPISEVQTVFNPYPWRQRHYGLSFKNFEQLSLRQFKNNSVARNILFTNTSNYLTEPKVASTVNLHLENNQPDRINIDFTLEKCEGLCTGILGFFKVIFDDKISFDNAPRKVRTNWQQFVLPVTDQRELSLGDTVKLVFQPDINPTKWKWDVTYDKKRRSKKKAA